MFINMYCMSTSLIYSNSSVFTLTSVLVHVISMSTYMSCIIINYPGKFSPGQSFHCSPPPTLPIPCILLHLSSLFHVSLYHVNPSFQWPASLSPSYFQLKHFISTVSSLLTICLNHLSLFCLKCSSRLSTPTFDAITVLSTISFNVAKHIILSILHSPLWGSQPLKNPCFHRPSLCPIHQHAANTCLIHNTFHSQRCPSCTQYSTKLSKLHLRCPHSP